MKPLRGPGTQPLELETYRDPLLYVPPAVRAGEEAASRYAARRRHPGHLPPDSVTLRRIARAAQMMEPLGVGPAIRIDTSMPIDLAALSAWVRGQR